MGRNVSEYLFLSLPYLRMCLRNQLGQKILPKFSAAKLSHVYRNLHYKQLPLFWKEQYWLLGNLSASLRTKASPKGQNNLSVSVLGQSETNCCRSGSQQPKAERTPHLPALQWAEGEGLVQPEPIYLCYCCSSAISQRENQQMCVTIKNPWHAPSPLLSPLNLYQIPHKLCHSLCIHDWAAVKGLCPSICPGCTIYTSQNLIKGYRCLVLYYDDNYYQFKHENRGPGKKTQTYIKIYFQFFICFSKKNQFPAPTFR